MKLRVGMPLVTRNGQRYTNAVVYKLIEGEHRTVVYVLTDYGNLRIFPSIEDVLCDYEVSERYIKYLAENNGGYLTKEDIDDIF